MKTKGLFQSALALCLVLLLLFASSCGGAETTADDSSGVKTSSKANASSEASNPSDSANLSDESEADAETETGTVPSGTGSVSGNGNTTQPAGSSSVKPSTASTAPPAAPSTPAAQTPTTPSTSKPLGLNPIDPKDYYGRSKLSGTQLTAYDRIVTGVEAMSSSIDLSGLKLTIPQLEKVLTYYRADYPQHFWLGSQYTTKYTGSTVLSFQPQYSFTGSNIRSARSRFDAAVNEILKAVSACSTQFEQELVIHDYLANNTDYVLDAANAHSAYGVFVDKKAVCEGYAKAFQYLCYQTGIPCLYVTGESTSPASSSSTTVAHAWNIVKLDGKYYHVDATWDDQSPHIFYAYFNVTDARIKADHSIDSDNYPLPGCTAANANYFTVNGGAYNDNYTVDAIGNQLRQDNLYTHVFITNGKCEQFIAWYKANIGAIAAKAGIGSNRGYTYSYNTLGNELILSLSAT